MTKVVQIKVQKDKKYEDYQKVLELAAKGAHPYVHYLGLRSFKTSVLLERINEGLSYAAFERLQKHFAVSAQELGRAVLISNRTLNRRKKEGRLEPDESDRLVRLSRIFGLVLQLFEGDDDSARDWLASKQIGLGGARPMDLVSSEVGAREVEALIGRLEHGVFS